MPDHDPDRLRKFRRDRINELGLVRIVTDRQLLLLLLLLRRDPPH